MVWLWIVGSRELSRWLAAFGVGQAGTLAVSPEQEGSPVDRWFFAGMLFLGLIVLARRGPELRRFLRANAPILLFFLYCAASVLWSDYPDIAFKRWTKALGDVVMVTVVLTDLNPLAAVKRLFTRASFLLIPASVLIIKYYPDLGVAYKTISGIADYSGATTNKNFLGVICLIFGLGSFWRFLSAYSDREDPKRTRVLFAHAVLLAMVFWLFVMARSMTSLACFLMASGLMVATKSRSVARRMPLVHLLVATVVVVSASTLFLGVGGGALEAMGKDPSLTGRTELWKTVISVSGNPLFGTGFESFWLGSRLQRIWSAYWWHPNEAHDGYLEVYLNLGCIGLLLLALLIATGYRHVLAELRGNPNVGRFRLAFFVVGVVYSFTEAGFRMLNPIWLTFLLATLAVPGGWPQTSSLEFSGTKDTQPKTNSSEGRMIPPKPSVPIAIPTHNSRHRLQTRFREALEGKAKP